MDNLQQANDRVHALIEALYIEALEAVLAHRVEQARQGFAQFEAAVHAHLREEHEHLLPRLSALGEPAAHALQPDDADLGALERRLGDTRRILARLDADSPRLADEIIDALEMLWRLRQSLEHHRMRERRMLYPRLSALLPASERPTTIRRLTAVCQGAATRGMGRATA